MAKISFSEATDLLRKLFEEQVQMHAFLTASSGIRATVVGSIDSATARFGLVVSDKHPANLGNWINVPLEERGCSFEYGDGRELSTVIRKEITEKYGESALIVKFALTEDVLALFFTI